MMDDWEFIHHEHDSIKNETPPPNSLFIDTNYFPCPPNQTNDTKKDSLLLPVPLDTISPDIKKAPPDDEEEMKLPIQIEVVKSDRQRLVDMREGFDGESHVFFTEMKGTQFVDMKSSPASEKVRIHDGGYIQEKELAVVVEEDGDSNSYDENKAWNKWGFIWSVAATAMWILMLGHNHPIRIYTQQHNLKGIKLVIRQSTGFNKPSIPTPTFDGYYDTTI